MTIDILKAREINKNLSQDDYCKGCACLGLCNVVLKEEFSILEKCGDRIELEDAEKTVCGQRAQPSRKATRRFSKKAVYESLGMKKVRGNLGGTYYE